MIKRLEIKERSIDKYKRMKIVPEISRQAWTLATPELYLASTAKSALNLELNAIKQEKIPRHHMS